ncbi:unnamed protein product [Toxocara canis]|uniref:HABP4_PAI-RBP1 domain-containing protein n=1 Tax=Toxocara canis TaxID=6265 RepID=A0A183U0Q5_TOXCA|nr:unnamed protein product [Toxocara canis]
MSDDDSEDDIAKDVLESVVDGEVASVASSEMAERQFISMKPPEARQSTTETAGSADLTLGDLKYGVISKQRLPTVEENEMRVKLERLTIAEKNTAEAVRQPPDEICVPLTVGKKHGGLEKFRVPESEKVAQRPLYERYMYEDSKSQWDDVYDDEYDDTFDFQQTFTVDTAQGDEIEVLEGVEPNMNRIVEETAEKEESAEQQNEDAVQRGRGKRAREAALKNKTRTGQQLDPSINASVTEPQADDASGFSTRDTEKDAEVRRSGGPPWLRGTAKGGERRTYTGGRERQLKERNKGSDRRRQADRKMRGGMF